MEMHSYGPSKTSDKSCFMLRVEAQRCRSSQLSLSSMDVADSVTSRQTAHTEVQDRVGRALASHNQSS